MTEVAAPRSHRALTLFLGGAAVIVALIGLKEFSSIVAPAFLALNLMIVVWPLMSVLKRCLPRFVAAIVTGLAAVTILALFFWALGWAGSLFVQEIPEYKDEGRALWGQLLRLASRYGVTSAEITSQLQGVDPGSVVSVVGRVVSNVSGVVSLLVVVISVLLFMIIDSIGFDERLERLGERHSRVLALALRSFAQGVRRYWVTSTVFGLIVAVVTWAGLLWIGVPLAIVWAVLSFVTNYIPNIGFIIGLLPAAVMGFLSKGLLGLVLVVVLYSVSNFVIQSMIQPKFTGEAVGVTSTVSFLSLLLWAYTLGPLGALLALPATLFVKAVLVDADPQMRWLNALIASNPRTSDEEPVLPVGDTAPVSDQPDGADSRSGYGDEVSGSSAGSGPDQPEAGLSSAGLASGTARLVTGSTDESRTGGSAASGPTPTSADSAPEVVGSPDAWDSLPDTASSPGAAPDPSESVPARSWAEDLPQAGAATGTDAPAGRAQTLVETERAAEADSPGADTHSDEGPREQATPADDDDAVGDRANLSSLPGADPFWGLPAHGRPASGPDLDLPGPAPAHALRDQTGAETDAPGESPSTPSSQSSGSQDPSRADGPALAGGPDLQSSGQVRPGGPDHAPEQPHGPDRVLEAHPETLDDARIEPTLQDPMPVSQGPGDQSSPAPQSADEPLDEPRPQRPWDGESTLELPAVSAPRRAKELVSPDAEDLDPYISRARSAGPRMQSSATPHWTD